MATFSQNRVAHNVYQHAHIATKLTSMMITALTVDKALSSTKKEHFVFLARKRSSIAMKVMLMMVLRVEFMKEVIGFKMER